MDVEKKLKQMLGEQAFQIAVLLAQIEELTKKPADEKKAEDEKK